MNSIFNYLCLCFFFSFATVVQGASGLHEELLREDEKLFKKGFNECDLAYLESHVSDELVFYHDQGGIQGKDLFMHNVRNNICSNSNSKPIRKLIKKSVSTHPLYDNGVLYGAIQMGEHEFYIRREGYPDKLTSTAKFNHVWVKVNGKWMLANVLSFDHKSPSQKSTIEAVLSKHHVPALAIGVIENGKISKLDVFGERREGKPAGRDTIFKVASLTKPIVTFITLKLIDEGKLELDEPLYHYWIDPDLVNDERYKLLTARNILTHQTGFDNWRWANPTKKLRFNFNPGSQHQYSGEGFEYLRIALEKKFNTTIESLAETYLFEPAGMKDTHFWWNEQVDSKRYAYNHDAQGNEIELIQHKTANASANLLTTIGDYSRFITYIMQQAETNPNLYKNSVSKQISLGERHQFGLGWEIFTDFSNNEYALLHTGRDPGVNTLAIFYPKSKNGYVLFMNGDNALPVMEHVLKDLYLGQELWQRR